MTDHQKIRTISLFSGGGGLDIGFEQAGFDVLFATDFNHDCCETLRMNRGNTISENCQILQEDISRLDLGLLPQDVDMIIGGPPCQSFSASGRRAGGAAGQLDQRGNLFKDYCRVVEYVSPRAFLFENVRGILATNKGQDFQNIVNAFAELGYRIDYRILDAEDYGVPQQRERMFIVGHKLDGQFLFPRPLYGPDSREGSPYLAVGDVIRDVPFTDRDREETVFEGGKYSYLLPLVPPGSNYLHFTAERGYPEPIFAYRSRFSDFLYKANPDTPVKTLIASPGKYTGPLHWDNRYLTVAEYKRIQGFPDEHQFYGERKSQIQQIGNSVCPKIAYYLALSIREEIFGIPTGIEYLQPDDKLSFDKRKGQKAQRTKEIHKAVMDQNRNGRQSVFHPVSFECYVGPSSVQADTDVRAVVDSDGSVTMDVYADRTNEVQAVLHLNVYKNIAKDEKIGIGVVLHGNGEYGVQTMWNAVDAWVKKSSHFNSLIELYGHFTEPHPIFEVVSFEDHSKLPIFKFAQHCMDFNNCSAYFPKEQLLDMWGENFHEKDFTELAQTLRTYRFDIRCHETNIAIPQGVYMVAYPFSLPYDKQMNFCLKEEDHATQ